MISKIERHFGLAYKEQVCEPTAADLELEKFRKAFRFPCRYVFDNGEMVYHNASLIEAQEIIAKNNLALTASFHNKVLTIKYMPKIAACKRINSLSTINL